MSDISTLLQEAKPLYFKRKKQRRRIKIAAGVIGCMMMGILITGMPNRMSVSNQSDFDSFYAYLYDDEAYDVLLSFNELSDTDTLLYDEYELTQVI